MVVGSKDLDCKVHVGKGKGMKQSPGIQLIVWRKMGNNTNFKRVGCDISRSSGLLPLVDYVDLQVGG